MDNRKHAREGSRSSSHMPSPGPPFRGKILLKALSACFVAQCPLQSQHLKESCEEDRILRGVAPAAEPVERRVLVQPDIEDPDPSVYQLRSPESSNISVCLFTDYDSQTVVPQDQESTVVSINSTSLNLRAMGSKSNGALHWSASTDFSCEDTFNETFYPNSKYACDATLVEKSFETDMHLNFQNLSVIGFRILLLKVAGFNLLMTLRLWSR